jgi:hypothetical protein
MKPQLSHHSLSKGGVLLYALVVMALGAVVAAAWIGTMSARMLYTESKDKAIDRRITLENSRLLATQYFLSQVLPGESGAALNISYEIDGQTIAAFEIAEWTDAPLLSTTLAPGHNVFAPGAGDGYTLDFAVEITNGSVTIPWLFQARSRSPLYGLDLLNAQRPLLDPSSALELDENIRNPANAILWRPNTPNLYGFRTGSFQTPGTPPPAVTLLSPGGASILQSNLAFPPMTSGPAGADAYNGALDVVRDSSNPNSLGAKAKSGTFILIDGLLEQDFEGITNDGQGTVEIHLLTPTTTRIFIDGNVETLRLIGQANAGESNQATGLPGLLIVLDQDATSTADLTQVEMEGSNSRRLYLAVRKTNGTAVLFNHLEAADPLLWRMGMTLENTPVEYALAGGSLLLTGGLRTDRTFQVSGGFMNLNPEPDPRLLERLADRIAWLETYRQ